MGTVHLSHPVSRIERHHDGVLVTAAGRTRRFDHVIVGAHADQALRLLADPTRDERRILGAFPYQPNHAILHSDPALMPKRRAAWASWNYRSDRGHDADAPVSVTYWMNRLQGIDGRYPLFLSLNPARQPDPALVHRTFVYDHPIYDAGAMAAQRDLTAIQGVRRTWFCGSYCGYGFHEDGLKAGMAAAAGLGVTAPWIDAAETAPQTDAPAVSLAAAA
jgi:predicted NAD/FAD-binding protein